MNDTQSMDVINQIRSKVDIVDIISEYLPLMQRGKNFFGVCPFHDDTHPSMSVSREKQIYKCFSCGASGNVFNFIMDYEHVSFREALVILANKTGIDIGNVHVKKENNKYEEFYKIYDLALKFFQNNINTAQGRQAKEYLEQRQIDESIIKEFSIGLALSSRDSLLTLLTKKKYSNKLLNELGLTVNNYDNFIDRIIFPLWDANGRVVGFSGRIYHPNSNQNKYVNTKETPIFKKGQTIYNYHRARDYARRDKSIIIMEGFMDVIRAYTIGVKNVVALMGTAMTKEQIQLIKRLSNQVILCFDGDDAGRKATLTNGELLVKAGVKKIKVIALENNEDPDTYIIKNKGEKFKALIENAMNYSDYKINSLKIGINFNSDIEKSNYINQVIKEASMIKDEIRVEILLKNLAKEFDLSYNTLEKRLMEFKSDEEKKQEKIDIPKVEKPKHNKYEKATYEYLYYMLVNEKAIIYYDQENIFFPIEKARFLASEISYYYKKYGRITIADFYTYLQDKKDLLALLNIVLTYDKKEQINQEDIEALAKVIREYNVVQEIKRLKEKMKNVIDPLEKAKIADEIRKLKIGSV